MGWQIVLQTSRSRSRSRNRNPLEESWRGVDIVTLPSSRLLVRRRNQQMRLPLGTIGGMPLSSWHNPFQKAEPLNTPTTAHRALGPTATTTTSCGAEFACSSAEIKCILLIFLQLKCELVKWLELVLISGREVTQGWKLVLLPASGWERYREKRLKDFFKN